MPASSLRAVKAKDRAPEEPLNSISNGKEKSKKSRKELESPIKKRKLMYETIEWKDLVPPVNYLECQLVDPEKLPEEAKKRWEAQLNCMEPVPV